MRSLAAVLLVAGCYSPSVTPGAPCSARGECPAGLACDRTGICIATDAPRADGGTCASGDGVCLYGCADLDTDCATTCGDGTCVGNANELCTTCAADCNTLNPVCGNGACEAGEAPTCYADCGPSPWHWDAEEAQLVSMIDAKRTSAYRCGGSNMPHAAPAFTAGDYQAAAREWVWEMAHQGFYDAAGATCNGRTFAARSENQHYTAFLTASGYDTIADALAVFLANDAECAILMDPDLKTIQVAVAHDQFGSYVLLMGP